MFASLGFADPFARNHCVVVAFTALAGRDAEFAKQMAEEAYRTTRSIFGGNSRLTGSKMLSRSGWAHVVARADAQQWADLAGVDLGERIDHPHCTLATFAKRHRTGSYLMIVKRHAVALINGKLLGYYNPRSIVENAYPVTARPAVKVETALPQVVHSIINRPRGPGGRYVKWTR